MAAASEDQAQTQQQQLPETSSPSPASQSFRSGVIVGLAKEPLKPGHIIVQRVSTPQAQPPPPSKAQVPGQGPGPGPGPGPVPVPGPGVHLLTSSHRPAAAAAAGEPGQRAPNRIAAAQASASLSSFQPARSSPQQLPQPGVLHPSSMMLRQQSGAEPGGLRPAHLPAAAHQGPVASSSMSTEFETGQRDRSADTSVVVHILDRKVRLVSETDPSSIYALARRWVRNDMPRKDQPGFWDCTIPHLPRPLSGAEADGNEAEAADKHGMLDDEMLGEQDVDFDGPVDGLATQDILNSHLKRFRIIRKRARRAHVHRIDRYRHRLAYLIPPIPEPPTRQLP